MTKWGTICNATPWRRPGLDETQTYRASITTPLCRALVTTSVLFIFSPPAITGHYRRSFSSSLQLDYKDTFLLTPSPSFSCPRARSGSIYVSKLQPFPHLIFLQVLLDLASAFLPYVPPLLRAFYTALNLRLLILPKFYTNFLKACKFPQIRNSEEQQHRMCKYCFYWLGDQLWFLAFLRKACLLPILCVILHQNMTLICTCPVVYRKITGLDIWLGDETRNVEGQ